MIPKKLKTALNCVVYTVVTVITIGLVYILYLNLKGEPAFIFGRSAMWVMTDSMEPEIPKSSYIYVKQATADDVKVGDVIVFESDAPDIKGKLNTHKVIDINDNRTEFYTMAVNGNIKDKSPAQASKIKGIYIKNLPFMTRIGRFLSTVYGITITVGLIFLLTLATFLPDIIKVIKQNAQKKKQARFDVLVKSEVERLKAAGGPDKTGESSNNEREG